MKKFLNSKYLWPVVGGVLVTVAGELLYSWIPEPAKVFGLGVALFGLGFFMFKKNAPDTIKKVTE